MELIGSKSIRKGAFIMLICRFYSDHMEKVKIYDNGGTIKILVLIGGWKMIVLLLIVIACCLLFGGEATKHGIGSIFYGILFLALIAQLASCIGCLD